MKELNNFAKNNSMINLNFKRLSQATNIENVASTQLINKKIRNSHNANKMKRSLSNNLKRDISDL
jgi:predicted small metal-binding protein